MTINTPICKDFRFFGQINSVAGSVMDNIAEGFERDGNKEFCQFLYIAKGSKGEVRSQSYRAFDAGFINNEQLEDLLLRTASIKNKTNKFIEVIRASEKKGNKYDT